MMAAAGKNRKKVARGWRTRYPFTTGEFIRSYLLKHREAYIYEVWDAFRKTLQGMGLKWWGSYSSFRKYFNYLQKLNLIRFTREDPSRTPQFKPWRFYTYVPKNIEKVKL